MPETEERRQGHRRESDGSVNSFTLRIGIGVIAGFAVQVAVVAYFLGSYQQTIESRITWQDERLKGAVTELNGKIDSRTSERFTASDATTMTRQWSQNLELRDERIARNSTDVREVLSAVQKLQVLVTDMRVMLGRVLEPDRR